jgi:hypothetical protein
MSTEVVKPSPVKDVTAPLVSTINPANPPAPANPGPPSTADVQPRPSSTVQPGAGVGPKELPTSTAGSLRP